MAYKAIGYCRVSKGDQKEIENSLQSQKNEIIKFATYKLGLNEDEIRWFIIEEANSAFTERADWTILEEAINIACDNKFKYFISFNQERFCRERYRSQGYKRKLKRAKVQIRFVSGDVENPNTLGGYMMDATGEVFAGFFSIKISEDTLRGCKENASTRDLETGYAYKNGGKPPFWLKSQKNIIGTDCRGEEIKKTIWVKNDNVYVAQIDEKIVSKTMWEWARYYFIELRLNQKLGIDKARDILNELEIPAPRKKYWATTCLYEAEKNESLIGIGIYNKRQFSDYGGGMLKDKSEWIIVENAHPALLNKDEFEALQILRQSKLKRKGTISRFQSNNEHLLIGYPDRFTCKNCGSKIISSGDVYTCGCYNTNGKKGCGAPYFSVKSDWLENKVLDEIFKSLSEKELEKHYVSFVKYYHTDDNRTDQTKNIRKAIVDKEKAQSNLIKSLSEMANMNEFALKAITSELDKISREMGDLKKEEAKLSKPVVVKIPTFEVFKTQLLRAKLTLTQSNLAENRNLVWCFVKSITLDPIEREVIAEFNKSPFSVFMENLQNPENKIEGAFAPSMKLVAGAGFEPTTFGL